MIVALDGAILMWIQEFVRNDVLTPFFTAVTRLGDKGLIWILISLLLLCFKKTREAGVTALLALLLCLLVVNLTLKNLIARPRPFDMIEGLIPLVERPRDFSFPSGHSASSFAAAVVFLKKLPRWGGLWMLLLAALIGISRLYVGVHYPSDVLAGIALGAGLGYLSQRIGTCITERKKKVW